MEPEIVITKAKTLLEEGVAAGLLKKNAYGYYYPRSKKYAELAKLVFKLSELGKDANICTLDRFDFPMWKP